VLFKFVVDLEEFAKNTAKLVAIIGAVLNVIVRLDVMTVVWSRGLTTLTAMIILYTRVKN